MRRHLCVIAFLLLAAATAGAQQATFTDVKVRFAKSDKREMDEKGADLIFDGWRVHPQLDPHPVR